MRKSFFCAALLFSVSPAWSHAQNDDPTNPVVVAPVMYYSEDSIAPPESPDASAARRILLFPFRLFNPLTDPNQDTAKPPKVPPTFRRPRLAGSSTGYIDNAIIGSQIRFRFDDDFTLQEPDRAEFFYAKCGCYRPSPDPNAPGPGAIPAKSANLQELQANVEYAPNRRFSVFAEVPGRWIQFTPAVPGNIPSASGIGDFRAGFKFALLAGEDRYLTFQMRAYFPTGNSFQGLGTNHYSVEPTLLYYQRFGERTAISSEFGDWRPIGGSNSLGVSPNPNNGFAGDILLYGLGAGYDVYSDSRVRFTPVLEFVGWSVLDGDVTATSPSIGGRSTSGVNIVNLKIGVRTTIGAHSSVYIGYGHALTNATWYQNMIRLEYRFAF